MSGFEDRLTQDLADLAHHRVALTRSSGKDDARPAVTDSASPSPSPSVSPSASASLTATPSAPPSSAAPSVPPPVDPAVFRFDGVGSLRLGMSVAEVEALGYSGGSISTFGCAQYFMGSPEPSLSVIVDPVLDRVRSIGTAFAPADFRTEAGIQVGSTEADVRAAYAGYQIQNLLARGFGQGSSGLLIAGPSSYMGFTIVDGAVSGIEIADQPDFATNAEVSCAAVTGNGQARDTIRFGGLGSVDLGIWPPRRASRQDRLPRRCWPLMPATRCRTCAAACSARAATASS